MAEDIEPPDNVVAGESFRFELTVYQDGETMDLTGATADWWLRGTPAYGTDNSILSTADSGVSVTILEEDDGSSPNGRVDIEIDQGVTDGLAGTYSQLLHIDDSGPGMQKFRGEIDIEAP